MTQDLPLSSTSDLGGERLYTFNKQGRALRPMSFQYWFCSLPWPRVGQCSLLGEYHSQELNILFTPGVMQGSVHRPNSSSLLSISIWFQVTKVAHPGLGLDVSLTYMEILDTGLPDPNWFLFPVPFCSERPQGCQALYRGLRPITTHPRPWLSDSLTANTRSNFVLKPFILINSFNSLSTFLKQTPWQILLSQ